MRKSTKKVIPVFIIISIIIILIIGIYFFSTSQTAFTQFTNFPSESSLHPGFWQDTAISENVKINTGANSYEFKSKYYSGSTSVKESNEWNIPDPFHSTTTNGCFQKIDVYKDGVLSQTFFSHKIAFDFGYENSGLHYLAKETEEYIITDDVGSTIKISMLEDYKADSGCFGYQNVYDLELKKDYFDISIDELQTSYNKGESIPIKIIVDSSYPDTVLGNLTVDLTSETVIGNIKDNDFQIATINPGRNEIIYETPEYDFTGNLNIDFVLNIGSLGENFEGLNYRWIKLPFYNADDLRLNTVRVETNELVPLVSYDLSSFKIKYSELTIETETIEGEDTTTTTTVPTSSTTTPNKIIDSIKANAKQSSFWVVVLTILGIVILLFVVGYLLNKRRRK